MRDVSGSDTGSCFRDAGERSIMSQTTDSGQMGDNSERRKGLPADASNPFYSVANLNALAASIEQMRQGRIVTKTLEELETMAGE